MKFVAKTSFHNAPEINLPISKATPNFAHELNVPKGHSFEVSPGSKSLKGITNQAEKQLISKLVMFDLVIVDDGTPESVDAIKKVNAEVKADNEAAGAAETRRKASESITVATLLQKLPEMIAAAVAAANVKK